MSFDLALKGKRETSILIEENVEILRHKTGRLSINIYLAGVREEHYGDQGRSPDCGGGQGDTPGHVVHGGQLGGEEPAGGGDGETVDHQQAGQAHTPRPVRAGGGEVGHDGQEETESRAAGEPCDTPTVRYVHFLLTTT